jgi:hypothetical protein
MKCKVFGVVIALSAVLAACDDLSTTSADLSPDRMVGILELIETDARPAELGAVRPPLAAPDTVDTGVPFDVTVTTIGLNTCWREAGARVESELRRVTITPYDRIDAPGSNCGDRVVFLPRTVSVIFTQRGLATLRVEGRRGFGFTATRSSDLAIERTVYVR